MHSSENSKRDNGNLGKDRKRIKKARRRIRKLKESSRLNKQQKARRFVVIAAGIVRIINKSKKALRIFRRLARDEDPNLLQCRKGSSKHLPVLRYLKLTRYPATTRRYADGIDACLRQKGRWKDIRRRVIANGVASICRSGGDK